MRALKIRKIELQEDYELPEIDMEGEGINSEDEEDMVWPYQNEHY